jgi:cysteine-rich repeat protein
VIRRAAETCDDGNTVGSDGCSPDCITETGWICPTPNAPCIATCGNGLVQTGESCDDGNIAPADGCDSNCQVEPGWTCPAIPASNSSSVTIGGVCSAICGDGLQVGQEACDDGNIQDNDGCSSDCAAVEAGYRCPDAGQPCTFLCGDGILIPEAGEACDDGNTQDGDGCSSDCTQIEDGWACPNPNEPCRNLNSGGLPIGAIIGIVVGVCAAVLLLVCCLVFWYRKQKRRDKERLDRELNKMRDAQENTLDPEDLKYTGLVLGKGNFGEVRKAMYFGEPVAVKFMRMDKKEYQGENPAELFAQELALFRKLQHPRIVRFLGTARQENGDQIIVSEFMEGGALGTLVKKKWHMIKDNLLLRLRILHDIARGCRYLHGRSPPIVHGDLNIGNVLLDENFRGKVSDFGLSGVVSQLKGGATYGAIPWMAPEVLSGADPPSQKSDVFSFGVVSWELFTGQRPYKTHPQFKSAGKKRMQALKRDVQDGWRYPVPETIPMSMRELIHDCWEADPDDRPDFEELSKRLDLMMKNAEGGTLHTNNTGTHVGSQAVSASAYVTNATSMASPYSNAQSASQQQVVSRGVPPTVSAGSSNANTMEVVTGASTTAAATAAAIAMAAAVESDEDEDEVLYDAGSNVLYDESEDGGDTIDISTAGATMLAAGTLDSANGSHAVAIEMPMVDDGSDTDSDIVYDLYS